MEEKSRLTNTHTHKFRPGLIPLRNMCQCSKKGQEDEFIVRGIVALRKGKGSHLSMTSLQTEHGVDGVSIVRYLNMMTLLGLREGLSSYVGLCRF